MLLTLFSAKGSPGVTSSALAIAALWPRRAVLIEADPTGGDVAFRCRAATGGALAERPNVLSLASAMRAGGTARLSDWTQSLSCGVDVIPGVVSGPQSQGMAGLWDAIAAAAIHADVDVIADVGRAGVDPASNPFIVRSQVLVPVLAATVESVMHAKELAGALPAGSDQRLTPLLVSSPRTARRDAADVDAVLADAGMGGEATVHLPLDHAALRALETGSAPSGRSRMTSLLRAAISVALRLAGPAESSVPA